MSNLILAYILGFITCFIIILYIGIRSKKNKK
jgi:hypothetical protein